MDITKTYSVWWEIDRNANAVIISGKTSEIAKFFLDFDWNKDDFGILVGTPTEAMASRFARNYCLKERIKNQKSPYFNSKKCDVLKFTDRHDFLTRLLGLRANQEEERAKTSRNVHMRAQ